MLWVEAVSAELAYIYIYTHIFIIITIKVELCLVSFSRTDGNFQG